MVEHICPFQRMRKANRKFWGRIFKAITDTPRSVNLLLEPHQQDVQWHQTGRTRDNWPARSTYQRTGWEMPIPNWSWKKWYVGQSCLFMQPNILKSRSGSDQRRGERTSHIKPSSSMPRSMKWWWKTSTDTNLIDGIDDSNKRRWNQFLQVQERQWPRCQL